MKEKVEGELDKKSIDKGYLRNWLKTIIAFLH